MQKKNKKKKFTRYTALVVCNIMVVSAIITRLAYLQIVKADEFKVRADSNFIRNISTAAPRGDIVDRNGVTLATSKQSFNLIYMETKENKKSFFDAMKIVFAMLDENGEVQEDDFPLKIKPFRFEFNAVKASDRKLMELRFKIDRGLADYLAGKKYEKQYNELVTEKEKDKIKVIHDEILKIGPEETFEFLAQQYGIIKQKSPSEKSSSKIKYINDNVFTKSSIEEAFENLSKEHDTSRLNLSLEEQRRYMIVKDAIKMQSFSGYKPVVIAKNIKRDTAFKFYERLSELPGIDVGNEPIRYYPYGDLASSVIGYISKINSMDKESYEEKGYDVGTDQIGTEGIEKVYENILRGSKGQRTVKVNKFGRIVEELFKKSPYPGENVQLTIDAKIQNAAEKALDDTMDYLQKHPRPDPLDSSIYTANATRGAAVAVDIKTGEILALVSRPGFDPNMFTVPGKLNNEEIRKYFNPDLKEFGENYIKSMGLAHGDSEIEKKLNQMFPLDKSIKDNTTIRQDMYDIVPKPFYNYATYTLSPPGSVFKPLTAIAGLEEGVINVGTVVRDTGVYSNYGNKWRCWKPGGHGNISVVGALKESCNYFFYNLGELLYEKYKGASREQAYNVLEKYAKKFGLGTYTGIEIPEKKGGVYNFKSSLENNTIMFYYSARDILKEGYEKARNKKFEPIDITIREKTESKELTAIKKDIRKTIEDSIKIDPEAKNKSTASIKYAEELQGKLKNLVNTYDKQSQSKYTDEQLKNAAQAVIDVCIWDANTQIYTPGNVINASIGQGDHNFTPIQLANYVATIANGGSRYDMHLFKKAYDDEKNTLDEKKPKIVEEANLNSTTIDVVKEGMKAVTEGGTATKAFDGFPIDTAGKTGSSTYSAIQNEFGRTSYGVYVGYAPADNPEIAVSVVIFDGGHGGYVAPVARAIYEQYFAEKLKKEYSTYTPQYNYPLAPDKNDKNSISDMSQEQSENTNDTSDVKKSKKDNKVQKNNKKTSNSR